MAESTSKKQDEKVTLTFKVMKKSEKLQTYKKSDSSVDMTYFNIIGCTKDDCFVVRVYMRHKFAFIKQGLTYRFTDVLKKGESYWAISSTSIGCTAPLKEVCSVTMELPEDESPQGKERSVRDALTSQQKSTVKGKIVQISPLKRRRNGTLAVRSLSIKDTSGVAKVCLFEQNADMDFERNQVVEVTSVYSKTFQAKEQLTATLQTKCQFIGDDDFKDIVVTEEDYLLDEDFDFEEDKSKAENLKIEVINEAVTYNCCPNEACRKKKLQNGTCIICKESSSGHKGCRVVVVVTKENGESITTALFNNDVVHLFGITDDDLKDNEVFICVLSDCLPVNFKAKCIENRLYQIEKNQ